VLTSLDLEILSVRTAVSNPAPGRLVLGSRGVRVLESLGVDLGALVWVYFQDNQYALRQFLFRVEMENHTDGIESAHISNTRYWAH
jgi:hypothetical protein